MKQTQQADVALGGVNLERSLPHPWVEYPGLYGAIFRYSETEGGAFRFCSCALDALENLFYLNAQFPVVNNADPARMAPLDSLFVPRQAALESIGYGISEIRKLNFVEGICHRCNGTPPALRWCHEMYGDAWKQAYGWFPHHCALEGGVDPGRIERHLPGKCPPEVVHDVEEYTELFSHVVSAAPFDPLGPIAKEVATLRKKARTLKTRIMRHFSSEAREAFGFKRVGEGWVTETMLFKSVQMLLPNTRLIRHFRGSWLGGLELDIYAPELGVGIEYQGEQHSSPVQHWGGEQAFERQRARDLEKKVRCEENNCTLVEVWHGTDVSPKNVRKILEAAGVGVL